MEKIYQNSCSNCKGEYFLSHLTVYLACLIDLMVEALASLAV